MSERERERERERGGGGGGMSNSSGPNLIQKSSLSVLKSLDLANMSSNFMGINYILPYKFKFN